MCINICLFYKILYSWYTELNISLTDTSTIIEPYNWISDVKAVFEHVFSKTCSFKRLV